ncbi:hypothetical protein VTO42DRAFT_3150 [Malbranchea cinnamomea]
MVLHRLAVRSVARSTRFATTAAASARAAWRQSARRGYATAAEPEVQAGSDLPWAIVSLGITVPSAIYLLKSSPETAHAVGHEAATEKAEAHSADLTQPTSQKVEAKLEEAIKTPVAEGAAAEDTASAAETLQQEKEEEAVEQGAPHPAMTEEKSAEEAKAEKAAVAPGEHPVVPDTAVQPSEAPSKKL